MLCCNIIVDSLSDPLNIGSSITTLSPYGWRIVSSALSNAPVVYA